MNGYQVPTHVFGPSFRNNVNGEQKLNVKTLLCIRVLCAYVTIQGVHECHPYEYESWVLPHY